MVTWIIRVVLAAGAVIVLITALGSRAPAAEQPATVAAVPPTDVPEPTPTVAPTPRPTATTEAFVERIVSRISRETPAAYPTSTPRPDGQGFVSAVDFGYLPSMIRIRVGQSVAWQNGGRELHDVTGEDDWHSGPIEPGGEYRHTFGFEGSFTYRCSVHPDMRGTVLVSP